MSANNPLNAYAGSLANVPGCRAWEIGRKAQPQTFIDSCASIFKSTAPSLSWATISG